MSAVKRIFVEKKKGFDIEARHLLSDLKALLGLQALVSLRIAHRYDIAGVSDDVYEKSRNTIFSEPPIDHVYDEVLAMREDEQAFAMEYLPGQYDQRADSAAQCVQILTQKEMPEIRTAKVIILSGDISHIELTMIKNYCINPVDSREADLHKPNSLHLETFAPADVAILAGFISMDENSLTKLMQDLGLAMNFEDLKFCQIYFRDTENRNPTITEIKVIDTYWSDHCRHTTFLTSIEDVIIEKGKYAVVIADTYQEYLKSRANVYGVAEKEICLMDIALIGMKELRNKGLLNDLEVSEEINACSIIVNADIDGENQEWLVMFKNETHNHPTEIEPFGGAATCLGGAIRDPLSGRAYVYQAMRVTGSGDPRTKIADTLPGKLPQRKISTGAAAGYSSYGNQIGLATGQVTEIYHPGYVAKRMEIGAVIAATPRKNVLREDPSPGDVIILLGGKTGRDGCGGATGSSKEHTEESIFSCGAEVQKGNPPTERKIQRLFRNPEVSTLIKKCNDFGAGGVSVAIGELADGLKINLDVIPKKYDGLDGTELAISESQERMAVVVEKENVTKFIAYAAEENLEAVEAATVTNDNRLMIFWKGKAIVDVSRDFLDTNGVRQTTKVHVTAPNEELYLEYISPAVQAHLPNCHAAWLANLQDLNVCSQKGLVERFDSTIGAGTVLMPFGGKYQLTPTEGMVAKLPVLGGNTSTGTIMTFGFNPELATWSPFHGAVYAVVEAVAKVVACGGEYQNIRLTLQEYFEKLGKDPLRWGKPFGALLGAYYAQKQFGIPAIGGKDSMSGTFKDIDVPPTLVAFAVARVNVNNVISPEFKKPESKVVLIPVLYDKQGLPKFEVLKVNFARVSKLIYQGKILSAQTVRVGGIAAAITKMSFGNKLGFHFTKGTPLKNLFTPDYGSIILEMANDTNLDEALAGIDYKILGITSEKQVIACEDVKISIEEALNTWLNPLEEIFPSGAFQEQIHSKFAEIQPYNRGRLAKPAIKIASPRVFIPVFPGTNCEYDTAAAFEKAGAKVRTLIFKNLTSQDIEQSLREIVKGINEAQIVMLPGGFSAGDEPDGSGKFIATVFRNPWVKEALMDLLNQRDGLMLGICNGFQALIKLGLLPYGEITDITENNPTLTYNTIGRHISSLVETKITSVLSPWLQNVQVGDVHSVAISHGEGRFVASENLIKDMLRKGQIATEYNGHNPNGSILNIEGITSPDGRIFGKMGHSERIGHNLYKNVAGEKDQRIFAAGVEYFRD